MKEREEGRNTPRICEREGFVFPLKNSVSRNHECDIQRRARRERESERGGEGAEEDISFIPAPRDTPARLWKLLYGGKTRVSRAVSANTAPTCEARRSGGITVFAPTRRGTAGGGLRAEAG